MNIRKRIYAHKSCLKNNNHKNKHLQSAWNKYGENSFTVEVLEYVSDLNELILKEQGWMTKLDACKLGYNKYPIAGSPLGNKLSDETKEKIRKKAIGRKVSDETKQKMSLSHQGKNNIMYGRNHTEGSKQKIRDNRGDLFGENNPFYGREHSGKTKEKISKANKGQRLRTKLTMDQVTKIKKEIEEKYIDLMWNDFYATKAIEYNVSPKTIMNIKLGYRWSNI